MVHFIPTSQRRTAVLAAQSDAPILIRGGSGSGKGGIARWIHQNGPRAGHALVVASRGEPLGPKLREAHEGTLVIHEIADWPLSEQRLLLQALRTHAIPLPGTDTQFLLKVRVIATTSHNLDSRVQGGMFHPELLAELSATWIEMPELGERQDEFKGIALALLSEIAHELNKDHIRGIDAATWTMLHSYEWPGNIRELRNVLRYAVSHCQGESLAPTDLPELGEMRIDFRATREQFDKIYIQELLKTYDFDFDKTCRMTQLNKETLLSKVEKYGIHKDGLSST